MNSQLCIRQTYLLILVACLLLLAGCQLSRASGISLPEDPFSESEQSSQRRVKDVQTGLQTGTGPVPPLEPALPKVSPLIQRLVANARNELEAKNAQEQAALQSIQQTATQAEDATAPLRPLSYYLTAADKEYPEPPASWANTQNFLVMGTDKRDEEPSWRTDVMMIVGLDRDNGRAAIISIPRDLYVDIPGTSANRINTVDYMGEKFMRVEGGGAVLVNQVIRKNFGIKIDHWLRIEMDGLSELVDALGGVTVTLDCPFFEPILNLDTDKWEYFTLPAGEVEMDGDTARWFVRLRLRESDIGRARRQRQFLGALQNQMLSTNAFLQLPDLWSALSNMYETDLGLFQTMNLARIALSIDAADIHSGGLSGKNGALEDYRTELGAQVLRIKDQSAVRNTLEEVWNGVSIDNAERNTVGTLSGETTSTSCLPVPLGPPANPYATPPPTTVISETLSPSEISPSEIVSDTLSGELPSPVAEEPELPGN